MADTQLKTKILLRNDTATAWSTANPVLLKGEIGMIANTRIVPSKKVKENAEKTAYLNPIIKIETDIETEEETPALTIYIKRGVNVEKERKSLARKTVVSADEIYAVSVSNDSKLVLAKFKK